MTHDRWVVRVKLACTHTRFPLPALYTCEDMMYLSRTLHQILDDTEPNYSNYATVAYVNPGLLVTFVHKPIPIIM